MNREVQQEVPFTINSAGQTLRGVMHRPTGMDDFPVFVLCHGYFGSNRIGPFSLYVLLARALANNGIGCLRFDCAGFGESDGNYCDASYSSLVHDLDSAVRSLSRVPGADLTRLGLLGHSLGGNIAIDVASINTSISRLCLLSPNPTRLVEDVRIFSSAQLEELQSAGKTVRKGIPAFNSVYEPINAGRSYERASVVRATTLLVFGEQDPYYSPAQYSRLAEFFGKQGTTVSLAEADHNFLPFDCRETLVKELLHWICPFPHSSAHLQEERS